MSEAAPANNPHGAGQNQQQRENGSNSSFDEGKIFLGGIAHSTTRTSVEEYCRQWGTPKDICVMDSKGYGFVTFVNMNDAFRFLEAQHLIDGRSVDVKAAMPKSRGGSKDKGKKMFVGGIPREVQDPEVRAHFEQYGAVEECKVVRDANRGPKGFAFIIYVDPVSMEKALIVRHTFGGRQVDCKRALPKEEHDASQSMRGAGIGVGGNFPGGTGGPAPRISAAHGGTGFSVDGKYQAGTGGGYGSYGVYGGPGGGAADFAYGGGYSGGGYGGGYASGGYGGGGYGGGRPGGSYEQRGRFGSEGSAQHAGGYEGKGPPPYVPDVGCGAQGGAYGGYGDAGVFGLYSQPPEDGGYGRQEAGGRGGGQGDAGGYNGMPGGYGPGPGQGAHGGSQGGHSGAQGGYGGAQGGYGGAQGGYSDQQGGYGGQQGPVGYGGAPAAHAGPSGGYGGPQTGYGDPQAGYGGPQGGYSGPQGGYGDPHGGYGGPQGGYGGPGGPSPAKQPRGGPGVPSSHLSSGRYGGQLPTGDGYTGSAGGVYTPEVGYGAQYSGYGGGTAPPNGLAVNGAAGARPAKAQPMHDAPGGYSAGAPAGGYSGLPQQSGHQGTHAIGGYGVPPDAYGGAPPGGYAGAVDGGGFGASRGDGYPGGGYGSTTPPGGYGDGYRAAVPQRNRDVPLHAGAGPAAAPSSGYGVPAGGAGGPSGRYTPY